MLLLLVLLVLLRLRLARSHISTGRRLARRRVLTRQHLQTEYRERFRRDLKW